MKKIILILLSIFILFSCSKNETENINNLNLPKQLVTDLNISNSGKILNNSGIENIKEVEKDIGKIEIQKENEKIKIYSPVYTLTGETLSGTSKVEVVFSGSTKKDTYVLKQFKSGDTSFTTNLRLDYGNIEKGENNYEVKFYDEKDEIIGSKNYIIEAEYEEVKVGGSVIYTNLKEDEKIYCENESEIFVIENGETKILENNCIKYSLKDDYYLSFGNLDFKGQGEVKSDLFINGKIKIKDFTFGCGHDPCSLPIYDKKNNILYHFFAEGIYYYNKYYYIINDLLKNKTYGFSYLKKEVHLDPGKSSSNFFIPGFINTNNLSIDQLKLYNYFVFYPIHDKISVFSLVKGKYKKNYIYLGDEGINTIFTKNLELDPKNLLNENKDFIEQKDIYNIQIGDKKFIADFKKMVQDKLIQKDLYEQDYFNYYSIYFTKKDRLYTLKFNNNSDEESLIKSISITSCSSNSSQTYDKEYTLTADENGNYKYNISEKLNNKCDIPYKINVYYEDGSIETGEYYVLFDY